jgi:hypothetical protein
MTSVVSNDDLRTIRDKVGSPCRAWQIKEELIKINIELDESTIRGRFIEMGEPLSGIGIKTAVMPEPTRTYTGRIIPTAPTPPPPPKPVSKRIQVSAKVRDVVEALKAYIPRVEDFVDYIERPIDKRLALHYEASRKGNWKYPITQGKQGTGKTYSHMYYAYKNQLPFFLFSCYEDFKLAKLFGDKTIVGGNVEFKEGMLTRAVQSPSVILFDEVNYVSNENSVDFHALLQNRELFIKDADNGNGKIYKLHDECKVGFAQNPKSAKYIGGNIKPSNFLGRCTFISYPEFTKNDIKTAITKRFPELVKEDVDKFTEFYFACCDTIEQAKIPVDISIRQLNNVIDLYLHGLPLKEAIEDGLTNIMDASSQPKNKEAFMILAQGVWKEMMDKSLSVGQFQNFLTMFGRRKHGLQAPSSRR